MRNALMITLLSIAFTLAGCPKRDAVKETPPAAGAEETPPGVESGEVPAGTAVDQQEAAMRAKLAERIIYFDFDNAEIRPEYRDIVAAHAQRLARTSGVKVRLEGHADERGSREYNIGLGERRAQSVRRALMLQGVGDGQIVTVSYGEERPVQPGSDETAWAKNRRVELVYGN
ncbi:MAG: peptidoglycan-associated lipoprotein Pal [Gemmatimonadetes bacterium]|nr:peptidoglycan-associated lipoprotein Pal [Gemmatimonadota bacterium]